MTTATDFEKLGVFYLGRPWDLATRKPKPGLVLYDSKDLVTHAVCVGMTGSGKTGLCLALLEEAAIDGIPALVIDPKGDLADLMLAFPELRPEDFLPWINTPAASSATTPSSSCARSRRRRRPRSRGGSAAQAKQWSANPSRSRSKRSRRRSRSAPP
jgi:DNA helicase HerA-like ATPase